MATGPTIGKKKTEQTGVPCRVTGKGRRCPSLRVYFLANGQVQSDSLGRSMPSSWA